MLRHLLVIHESKTARNIIRNYVLAGLNDITITDAKSPEEGIGLIGSHQYDIILCAQETGSMSGFEIYSMSQKIDLNKEAPFIFISPHTPPDNIKALLGKGHRHLFIPFTSYEICHYINELSKIRQKRQFHRISIKGTTAKLEFGSTAISADVINISTNGILCDLIKPKDVDIMLDPILSLNFSPPYENQTIENVWCKLVRAVVLDWDERHIAKQIRTIWQIIEMPEQSQTKLMNIITAELKRTGFEQP